MVSPEQFHKRLSAVEKQLSKQQAAPTVPKYNITVPTAGKVLQARCLSTDPAQAFAVALLGSGSTNLTSALWFSYDMAFDSSYIAFLTAHYSEDECVSTLSTGGAQREYMGINAPNAPSGPMKWMVSTSTQFTIGGPVAGATWYHIDWMTQASPVDSAFYVNGINQSITPDALVRLAARVEFGVPNYSMSGQDVFIYYRNIKAGTTMGASDLFDGTLLSSTVWPFNDPSSPTAQLSVVDNPF